MTKERREEAILVALVVSVAVHVGLMLLAKPQIMTQILPQTPRTARRAPMRVVKNVPRPDPVKIAAIMDAAPRKDAPPVAKQSLAPAAAAPLPEAARPPLPTAEAPAAPDPKLAVATVFDVKPVGLKRDAVAVRPLTRIETPSAGAARSAAPEFASAVLAPSSGPALAAPASSASAPESFLRPVRMTREAPATVAFKPAEEIYKKVDEQVVAEEKAAVRTLVETEGAAELKPFVNVQMTSAETGPWRYFKVMLAPRMSLKAVPKDVVVLIDGSGSIGNDRLGSCRKAARRILRTATNTGDRFNLVVFRDAFSYAFRTWRECDAASFDAGDRWLARQTAHGRTDVFSTISSVLTLPRDPARPLIALVVTDGDANMGVSDTAEILSKFTALNDGLVSVYMYGVKSSANRELIDVLTHGNRGESFVFEGWRWSAGEGMEGLSERFRDPVLSDLRIVFSSGTKAEAYPRLLRNLYRGGTLEFVGRVPAGTQEVAFSLKGLNGNDAYEGFFKLPFATAPADPTIVAAWRSEQAIDLKLRKE